MSKKEWKKQNYTENEIIEMYAEYIFVKQQLGEIKTEEN